MNTDANPRVVIEVKRSRAHLGSGENECGEIRDLRQFMDFRVGAGPR
jgi:hypothetical protein